MDPDYQEIKDTLIALLEAGKLNDLMESYTVIRTFMKVYTYLGKDCNYLIKCAKIITLEKNLYKTIKERAYALKE